MLEALEICAGAGGQARGLELAGFAHTAAIEIDPHACATLRHNRPQWQVLEQDVREVEGSAYRGVDLIAGGVPCPPFSIAGKQLGAEDERDLFPEALRLVEQARPTAVMIENVRGLASEQFRPYRASIARRLTKAGYESWWRLINASDHGTPQLRPRYILVAIRGSAAQRFSWPAETPSLETVGSVLEDLMAARGWPGVSAWALRAKGIAPTIVGGSKKHGGPDLGPTRARARWRELGVDGLGIADEAPGTDFPVDGDPRLTIRMVARIQGFDDAWHFVGRKTAAYRQVGNAFPPPVARAVARAIHEALHGRGARAPHMSPDPLFAWSALSVAR